MKSLKITGILLFPMLSMCSREKEKETVTVINNQISDFHDIQNGPSFIQRVAKSTVLIDGNGTASFVRYKDKELLMTNHHVMGAENCLAEGCYTTIMTNFQKGEKSKTHRVLLKPIAANPDTDVAFFTFTTLNNDYTPTTDWAPESFLTLESHSAAEMVGKDIFIVGHPAVALKKWSTGKVIEEKNKYIDTTSFAIGGNSGSPVVTDNGTLVAIHHSGNREINDLSHVGFNRVSHHSPTELLIAVLEEGLKNSADVGAFPFLRTGFDTSFTESEMRRFAKARKNLPLAAPATTETYAKKLQDQCKTALDTQNRTPMTRADDFSKAVHSCFEASFLLSCQMNSAKNPFFYCPATNEESLAWENLFVRLAESFTFPGDDVTTHLYWYLPGIYRDVNESEKRSRGHILDNLKKQNKVLDLRVAAMLVALGGANETLGELSAKDLLLSYKKQPFYWRNLESVIQGMVWLRYENEVSLERVQAEFRELAKDSRLTLEQALILEKQAFLLGFDL